MGRKLIKQGGQSYTVYVPKKWVVKQGLVAGDELDVQEQGNTILFSTKKKRSKSKVSIAFQAERPWYIRARLCNLYRSGFDEIEIEFKTKKQRDIIVKYIDALLLGFEVTNEKGNKLIIESVTEPGETRRDALLRKMFFIIKDSLEIIQTDIERSRFSSLSVIQRHTEKIAECDNFCRRSISKESYVEKGHFYWGLFTYLHMVQLDIVRLYETFTNKPRKVKNVLELVKEITTCVSLLEQALFEKDIPMIEQANNKADLLKQEISGGRKISESAILLSCNSLIQHVHLMASPVIGILH